MLVMIHAHVLDAWTHPLQRATPAFRYLNIVAGFAAPWFLWLAGASLMLTGDRLLQRGESRRAAAQTLVARGLEVFVLAFAFRLMLFVCNPGGSALSLFRVDILNVMGPAMALVGVVWGLVPARTVRIMAFSAIGSAVAFASPVVREAAWVQSLPVWLQWHLRPAGEHTVFTLFPWVGFVFMGAAAGTGIASCRTRRSEERWHLALGLFGLLGIGLGFYTATLPSIYRHASFWTTSPTFFFIRVGLLLVMGSLLFGLATWLAPRNVLLRPLGRLGRASLFVYWVHIPIVYGWLTAPFRHHLVVWQTMGAFVAFSVAMYALIPLRDQLLGLWSTRGQGTQRGRALAPGR